MRTLVAGTNIDAPSGDYPKGRVRDKNGGAGTVPNEVLFGDIIQFFQKMIIDDGTVENGLPDNVSNGYQLMDSLVNKIEEVSELINRNGVKILAVDENYTVQPGIGIIVVPLGSASTTITFDATALSIPGEIIVISRVNTGGNNINIDSTNYSISGDTIHKVVTDGSNYYLFNDIGIRN